MTNLKKLEMRFAVGNNGHAFSNVWRVWSWRDDVYLAYRNIAHVEKISFHASGICRAAFTKEFGATAQLSDRATKKWKRAPTPPPGQGKASLVFLLGVPTDYLSKPLKDVTKPVTWLLPAPPAMATVVELFFTNDARETISEEFAKSGIRTLLNYTRLPSGEAVVVAAHNSEWDN